MKISVTRAAALGAVASGLAIAGHALLGHSGLAACLPEVLGATALVAAGATLAAKAGAKVSI